MYLYLYLYFYLLLCLYFYLYRFKKYCHCSIVNNCEQLRSISRASGSAAHCRTVFFCRTLPHCAETGVNQPLTLYSAKYWILNEGSALGPIYKARWPHRRPAVVATRLEHFPLHLEGLLPHSKCCPPTFWSKPRSPFWLGILGVSEHDDYSSPLEWGYTNYQCDRGRASFGHKKELKIWNVNFGQL